MGVCSSFFILVIPSIRCTLDSPRVFMPMSYLDALNQNLWEWAQGIKMFLKSFFQVLLMYIQNWESACLLGNTWRTIRTEELQHSFPKSAIRQLPHSNSLLQFVEVSWHLHFTLLKNEGADKSYVISPHSHCGTNWEIDSRNIPVKISCQLYYWKVGWKTSVEFRVNVFPTQPV